MKKVSMAVLQSVVVLLGIAVGAMLLIEPLHEGRNAHATLTQVYLHDPFLACVYLASIAFFLALYQVFKLLGCAGRNEWISPRSAKALRTIRYCALVLIGFLLAAEAHSFLFVRGKDDIAGGVMLGLFLILMSAAVAITAGVMEHNIERKSRSDRNP